VFGVCLHDVNYPHLSPTNAHTHIHTYIHTRNHSYTPRTYTHTQGALSIDDIAEVLELKSITKRHWKIVACSAVTGDGLITGVDWVVSDIASRIFMLD
jgi:hypothetical protein